MAANKLIRNPISEPETHMTAELLVAVDSVSTTELVPSKDGTGIEVTQPIVCVPFNLETLESIESKPLEDSTILSDNSANVVNDQITKDMMSHVCPLYSYIYDIAINILIAWVRTCFQCLCLYIMYYACIIVYVLFKTYHNSC